MSCGAQLSRPVRWSEDPGLGPGDGHGIRVPEERDQDKGARNWGLHFNQETRTGVTWRWINKHRAQVNKGERRGYWWAEVRIGTDNRAAAAYSVHYVEAAAATKANTFRTMLAYLSASLVESNMWPPPLEFLGAWTSSVQWFSAPKRNVFRIVAEPAAPPSIMDLSQCCHVQGTWGMFAQRRIRQEEKAELLWVETAGRQLSVLYKEEFSSQSNAGSEGERSFLSPEEYSLQQGFLCRAAVGPDHCWGPFVTQMLWVSVCPRHTLEGHSSTAPTALGVTPWLLCSQNKRDMNLHNGKVPFLPGEID